MNLVKTFIYLFLNLRPVLVKCFPLKTDHENFRLKKLALKKKSLNIMSPSLSSVTICGKAIFKFNYF